ncbi:MAG: sodium-dependent transporter [Succiniclasticum sp.]|jgi:NSS family neurotransmitter:Na+ symporter|nr:sodium-dependent transporter [Succiniclasticum sp.]MEE3479672.1 sodium-dependent transporter [Succiniclasticum sp.]
MGQNTFSTRLGFILVSAGCAIGLGNVWRFPFITGKYGGATFVLLYLVFLAILGLPIMVAEFAVGRASVHSPAKAFNVLEPKGSKWHRYKYVMIGGNILLMMYYTTISGWMFYYFYKMLTGAFAGLTPQQVGAVLGDLLTQPGTMAALLVFVVLLGFFVCYLGVQAGVERITKVMMTALLLLMVVLAVNSLLLPGSEAGLRYYLYPDFSKLSHYSLNEVIFNAMGQAFFTLSIGQGSLSIFGSYIGKEKRLTGEAVWIIVLDTFVALMAGLIIFPACFSYGINPGAGPNLLFVTLPNVFNHMMFGRFWGTLFFLFMIFASMSTVIAIFEFITGCFMELTGLDRKTIIRRAIPVMIVLSLPCVLGFNVWSGFQPFGPGSGVLDLEDFIVSNNLLPIGSLVYMAFCTTRYGWGWDNFIKEADTGEGLRFPRWLRFYVTYILPLIVLYILVNGYIATFGH